MILPSSVDFLLKKLQPELQSSPSKPRPRVPFALPKESQSAQTGRKVKRERCHRVVHWQSQKIQLHTTGHSPKHIKDSVNWNQHRYAIPLLLKLWDALYSPLEAREDAGDAMGGSGGSKTDKVEGMAAEERARDKEAARMKEQQEEKRVIADQGAGDEKATESEIR
jgi:hypothetical protein